MKISIITVSYNSASSIRDTLISVLNQSYDNIEYIVVDGKSSDSTIEIVKEYELLFKGKMKWISEKDNGLYDAMNKGIKMASGDVIGTLNSDDFFTDNDVIQTIANEFVSLRDLEVVYGDIHFVNPNNLKKIVRCYSSNNFKVNRFRYGFMPAHPSCYIKRHCFEKFGYYKEGYIIAADFEILMRLMLKGKVVSKYIPIDIVTMRTGGVSTESFKSRYLLNREIVKACKDNGVYTNMFLLVFKYFIKIFEIR